MIVAAAVYSDLVNITDLICRLTQVFIEGMFPLTHFFMVQLNYIHTNNFNNVNIYSIIYGFAEWCNDSIERWHVEFLLLTLSRLSNTLIDLLEYCFCQLKVNGNTAKGGKKPTEYM